MHPATLPIEQLLKQCQIRRQRRSGPGGQHRNKVETGVIIRHQPTEIEVSATERRSQEANRLMAIQRLRLALAIHVREPVGQESPTTDRWRSRCRNGRLIISAEHEDYPAILAEALDRLVAYDDNLAHASAALQCTASQLTRLVQREPAAIAWVNQRRQTKGLSPLR